MFWFFNRQIDFINRTIQRTTGVLIYDLRELYKPLNPFEYFDLEGDNTNLPSQAQYKSPD